MLCTETKMASEKFLDELVNFLGDPMFQIPVRTFMDENCLIFDPSVKPTDDHKEIHAKYKHLVNALLEGFGKDTGISPEEAVSRFHTMCDKNEDLKEFFEVLFDQVVSSTDFDVFYGAMAKRNIVIQQQVLVMIMASTGVLPASFSLDECGQRKNDKDIVSAVTDDKQEENILKQVMRASEEEHKKLQREQQEEKEALRKTIELSKAEAQALQGQRKQIEQQLENMTLETPPAAVAPVAGREVRKKPAEPAKKVPGPLRAPPPAAAAAPAPTMSGSDAANAWLQSAQDEASNPSAAHAAVAQKMAHMTPEEIKQRQEYLAAQRDKLIAMKKKKREEQLKDSVQKQPQRPASARAARSAMTQNDQPNEDDEKKLAMRKAIADKLREEVIGK